MAYQSRPDTNISPTGEKQFDERVIHVNRVARVVKGGRRFRFQALVAMGDHNGKVGVGVAKGVDVATAIAKANGVAQKNMAKVHLFNSTLPHEVQAKVGGANVLILPAAPGTGIIAGGSVRIILEVAGVENALSKSLGSTNRMNTAYAAVKALGMLEPASNWTTRKNITRYTKPAVKTLEKPAAKVAKESVKKSETAIGETK